MEHFFLLSIHNYLQRSNESRHYPLFLFPFQRAEGKKRNIFLSLVLLSGTIETAGCLMIGNGGAALDFMVEIMTG